MKKQLWDCLFFCYVASLGNWFIYAACNNEGSGCISWICRLIRAFTGCTYLREVLLGHGSNIHVLYIFHFERNGNSHGKSKCLKFKEAYTQIYLHWLLGGFLIFCLTHHAYDLNSPLMKLTWMLNNALIAIYFH